jgi:hypothetical protein
VPSDSKSRYIVGGRVGFEKCRSVAVGREGSEVKKGGEEGGKNEELS